MRLERDLRRMPCLRTSVPVPSLEPGTLLRVALSDSLSPAYASRYADKSRPSFRFSLQMRLSASRVGHASSATHPATPRSQNASFADLEYSQSARRQRPP